MFNGLRVSLEGKVSSVRETMVLRQDGLERRIARAEREVDKAVERGRLNQVHHKTSPAGQSEITGWLGWKLTLLQAGSGCVSGRSGYGGSSMHLEANGYGSHEEWLSGLEGFPERRVLRTGQQG